MLHSIKMQAMFNANQTNPKSRIATAGHSNPPEIQAQQNAVALQINTIVQGNANFTAPDAPTGVIAEQHDGYFDISWTAPVKTGGTLITGYSIQAYNCSSGKVKTFVSDGAGTGPYRISVSMDDTPSTIQVDTTGNGNGGLYTFNVAAVNVIGLSEYTPSAPACQLAYTNPDAPVLISAVAGFNGTAELTWTAPAQFGGISKTAVGWTYRISVTPAGGSANTTRIKQSPSSTIVFLVTGLTNGTSYTFAVRLENVASSPVEDAVSAYSTTLSGGIPGAPKIPLNLSGQSGRDSEVALTWVAAETPGDSPITGYTILAYDYNTGLDLTPVVLTGTGTSYTYGGLTNGFAYDFYIKATNANGTSPYSTTAAGSYTPYTTQSIPNLNPYATFAPDYSTATVTWGYPLNTGGNSLTGFHLKVYRGDDTLLYDIPVTSAYSEYDPASPTSLVVKASDGGWALGDVIYFKVAATNLAGDGPFATSVQYGPPNVPTSLVTDAYLHTDGAVTFYFTPPGDVGNISPITGYVVLPTVVGGSDLPAQSVPENSTVVATGLTNGTDYTFKVAAVNYAGQGAYSTSSSAAKPFSFADAPTNLIVTPGNQEIALAWTDGSGNGSAISGHTITVTDVAADSTSTVSVGDGTSYTVGNLVNGTQYRFSVTADNLRGSSQPSATSNPVAPYTTPDAPTNLVLTPGNQEINVAWTEGSANGSEISGHTITVTNVAASTTSTVTISTGGRSHTVGNLVNGTQYRFSVIATNARGNSQPSAISDSIAPFTFPSAPTNLVLTSGDGLINVAWTKGSGNGSEVFEHTVTTIDVAAGTSSAVTVSSTTTTDRSIENLDNAKQYRFFVTARNARGNSVPSATTNAITPRGPPGVPLNVTPTAGVTSAVVSWLAPSYNGGSVITSYSLVARNTADGPNFFNDIVANPAGTGTTYTYSGLTAGATYIFKVRATNISGDSDYSGWSSGVVPYTVPGVPTSVVLVTAGDTSITVSWSAPASNGSAITAYTLRARDVVASADVTPDITISGSTSGTFTGLTNGKAYTFRVAATNAAGTSSFSTASSSFTPFGIPGVPTGVSGTASASGQIAVSWSAPASNGGSAITSYSVLAQDISDVAGINDIVRVTPTTGTTFTVTGITDGKTYTFKVRATNLRGSSAYSTVSSSVPTGLPSAPAAPTVSNRQYVLPDQTVANWTQDNSLNSPNALIITWTAPSSPLPITGYVLRGYNVTTSNPLTADIFPTGTGTSFTLVPNSGIGLTNAHEFTFQVAATCSAGRGAFSTASSSKKLLNLPRAIQYFSSNIFSRQYLYASNRFRFYIDPGNSILTSLKVHFIRATYTGFDYNPTGPETIIDVVNPSIGLRDIILSSANIPGYAPNQYYISFLEFTNAAGTYIQPSTTPYAFVFFTF